MDRVARRSFLIVAGALLTLPLAGEAQQVARLPRIRVLSAVNASTASPNRAASIPWARSLADRTSGEPRSRPPNPASVSCAVP